jgi:hypothetical protein
MSTKTVRRRLKEVHLIARQPATGPILTALHKTTRLSFCLNHQEWIVVLSFCENLVRGARQGKVLI